MAGMESPGERVALDWEPGLAQDMEMEKALKLLLRQNERILQALSQIETRLSSMQQQVYHANGQVPPLEGSLGLTVDDRSNVVDMTARAPMPQQIPASMHPANHPQGADRWMKEMTAIAQVVESIQEVAGSPMAVPRRGTLGPR
jgi:hypothetical protein